MRRRRYSLLSLAVVAVGFATLFLLVGDTGKGSAKVAAADGWVTQVGAGFVAPACGSSSVSAPTCVNGTPTVTLSWAWDQSSHRSQCANVSIDINGNGTGLWLGCTDSYTFTGLSGRTYVFDLTAYASGAIPILGGGFGGDTVTMPNCAAPDLSPSDPVLSGGSLVVGGNPAFYTQVGNYGTASAGPFDNVFQVDVGNDGTWDWTYLMTPSVSGPFPSGWDGVSYLPAYATPSLDPVPAPSANVYSGPIPFAAGTYGLRVCADMPPYVGGMVAESNEGNNCSGTTVVTVAPAIPVNGVCAATHYNCTTGTSANNVSGAVTWTWSCNGLSGGTTDSCSEPKPLKPDLTAGLVSPTTATVGIPVTFSATITNGGPVPTPTGFTNLLQSATDASGANATDIRTSASTALAAGGLVVATFLPPYTFASAGTLYFRVCADKSSSGDSGVIDESDESNNCSPVWTAVTASPAVCANFANNPPLCTVCTAPQVMIAGVCTNPPTCANFANNPPLCTICTAPQIMVGGVCTNPCANNANNPPLCNVCTAPQVLIAGVCVNPPAPTVTLTATPDRITSSGGTTRVSWTATNATSCTITRNGVLWISMPPTVFSGFRNDNITSQTTYILTCTNTIDPPVSATKIVNLQTGFQEF